MSFSYLKLKHRGRFLIILMCFFTFLIPIYYSLHYNPINWESLNNLDKNMDLETHANMDIVNLVPPEITIIAPLNNTYYKNPPLVQINTTDTYKINQTWYLIIGSGENKTFTGNSVEIDINLWEMQPDGLIMIRFYANNSIGQEGFIDLQVVKDTIQPTIIIHSPQNGTIVGEEPPDFNVTIFDDNFHKFWFTFNISEEKYFWLISPGNNIVWLPFSEWHTIPPGHLLIRFFVNDTAGNSNSFDIMIIKQLIERKIIIPGMNSSLLYLILILTITVIIKSAFRKNKNL